MCSEYRKYKRPTPAAPSPDALADVYLRGTLPPTAAPLVRTQRSGALPRAAKARRCAVRLAYDSLGSDLLKYPEHGRRAGEGVVVEDDSGSVALAADVEVFVAISGRPCRYPCP